MFNRSKIMKVANKLAKRMSRPQPFKSAWRMEKYQVVEKCSGSYLWT